MPGRSEDVESDVPWVEAMRRPLMSNASIRASWVVVTAPLSKLMSWLRVPAVIFSIPEGTSNIVELSLVLMIRRNEM